MMPFMMQFMTSIHLVTCMQRHMLFKMTSLYIFNRHHFPNRIEMTAFIVIALVFGYGNMAPVGHQVSTRVPQAFGPQFHDVSYASTVRRVQKVAHMPTEGEQEMKPFGDVLARDMPLVIHGIIFGDPNSLNEYLSNPKLDIKDMDVLFNNKYPLDYAIEKENLGMIVLLIQRGFKNISFNTDGIFSNYARNAANHGDIYARYLENGNLDTGFLDLAVMYDPFSFKYLYDTYFHYLSGLQAALRAAELKIENEIRGDERNLLWNQIYDTLKYDTKIRVIKVDIENVENQIKNSKNQEEIMIWKNELEELNEKLKKAKKQSASA
eukprot:NODE_279_length_10886_cov_0.340039.p3 type:complete len:322 gc:universal NODE_279_length_10886_cov_0.340039:9847-8882(-)